uniref:Leucine-rich repeat-containing protein 41 n=1 Tax=Amphiprion percula TaxID=161767 RepID=A0A3P8TWX8_AMPPE
MPDTEHRDLTNIRLKELCFGAVRKHFAALGTEAVLDLPTPLMKELLPHLTICQLDELQPVLNQKGISTHSEWVRVLQDMYGPNHVIDLHSEEEAKHEVMRILFPLVFYGFTNSYVKRNIRHLSSPTFLWAAAKCIQHFLLVTSLHKPLQSLTAEHWPLLNLLEKHIKSVGVSQPIDLSKRTTQRGLYVLHRLLDHGVATKLVVHVQCPIVLAWLLHQRGSQYVNLELKTLMHCRKASWVSRATTVRTDGASCSPGLETEDDQGDQVIPCKSSKLDSVSVVEDESGKENSIVDPQVLCRTFTPCDDLTAEPCPWGQITCLKITQCGPDCLEVLYSALPTFFCLHSLSLHSTLTFRYSDVLGLAGALKQLSDSSCSSLTDLCVSILPNTNLLEILLDASPTVTSLHVEIHTVMFEPCFLPLHPRTAESDMPVSNPCLKTLNLEDMKLCDCLPDVLNLLGDCKLKELHLNDCRLLEKCTDKEETLQQLVGALKTVASLHTLSLAQNRLAKHVCALAELFSGSSPSSVKRLDISSNFIQPAELLEFAKRLETHRPPHQLTLDLRKNPGDRDPDTWNTALKRLRPFSVLLVEGWKSTDTMVDHISNM